MTVLGWILVAALAIVLVPVAAIMLLWWLRTCWGVAKMVWEETGLK